jgi:hypothetical protein
MYQGEQYDGLPIKENGMRQSILNEDTCPPQADEPRNLPCTKILYNLSRALRSRSSYLTCPYCNHSALTRVEKKKNKCNIITCVLSIGIGWAMWQCFRGKDFSCDNVNHYCFKCDAKLAEYRAC